MASITFYGHVPMTYPDYIDTATGKMTTASRGNYHNVTPRQGKYPLRRYQHACDGRFVTSTA